MCIVQYIIKTSFLASKSYINKIRCTQRTLCIRYVDVTMRYRYR
jgi:hypothetical protein